MMKKTFIDIILITIFTIIILIAGCDDTIKYDDLDKIVIPSKNVSYKKYIQPIFNVKCSSSGCHNDADRGGESNLSLTSHINATANPLYVFPFDTDNSVLIWAIEGRSSYPMPPVGYPPLTENQIAGIKTWIKEGCLNN